MFRNVALVGGEGEGNQRKYQAVGYGNPSGLDRYEIFVEADDISSNDNEITESEYLLLLSERGIEALAETGTTESFEGIVENQMMYVYKEHYQMGDIVQVKNKYNITATARVVEIIESENETGYHAVPTFSTWEV